MEPMITNPDYNRLLDLVESGDAEAEGILAGLSAAEAARVIRDAYAASGRLDVLRDIVKALNTRGQ
jgi:hypothetical protein